MKYILSTFLSLIVSICLSQQIDYSHFNTDLMNKAMLKEFNMYRRSLSLDTLVYSEELYKTFSKPNCVEVSNSGGFYHPYINTIWATSDIKPRIAKESLNKIGGTPKLNGDGSFWMDTHENAFRTTKTFNTYEELAEYAIYSWSISTKGHRETQMMSFMTMGLPGMYSCHSELGSNGYVYIYINFVKIRRS
jgi:hypothetical protein